MFHTVTMDPIGMVAFFSTGILVGMLIYVSIDAASQLAVIKARIKRANKIEQESRERTAELKEGE